LHILFNESWLGQNLKIRLLLGIWIWIAIGPKYEDRSRIFEIHYAA
jgi:hypothetical protein